MSALSREIGPRGRADTVVAAAPPDESPEPCPAHDESAEVAALRTEREAQLADHLAQVDEARRAVEAQQRRLDTEGADIERRLQLLADREHALQEREKASQRALQRSLDVALKTARQEVDEVVTELRARAATLEREAAARAERQAPPLSTGDAGGLRAEARTNESG